MNPVSIKIFLVHGRPDGLRTAELSNWSGIALAAPRTELKALFEREEMQKPGIYLLTGTESGDDAEQAAIYIGEAENTAKRLHGHSGKDFWSAVTAFVSKDNNLTKAHVRYLEGKLIEIAEKSSALKVMNSASSGAHLPEAERAEMDQFLDNVLQLLPILGISNLKTPVSRATSNERELSTTIKGLMATGSRTADGFVVFAGSDAVLVARPSATLAKRRRDELVEKGLLVKKEDRFSFVENVEFSSPSMAGRVVHGGSVNGLTCWKNAEGRTLKEIEATSEGDG